MEHTSFPGGAGRRAAAVAAAAALLLAACDSQPPLGMGDYNAIVVTAPPALWGQIADEAMETLEGSVFTVRDERAFRVTYQEPTDSTWANLRRLRQLLLIGKVTDPWMQQPIENYRGILADSQASLLQVQDVWARDQLVTLAVLEEETDVFNDIEVVRDMLPAMSEMFHAQYREWVVARMFSSGRDSSLAEELFEDHGFSLLVPEVYDYRESEGVHLFRNDNPDPSELIRQFAVAWIPIPPNMQGEDILAWRADIVERHYDYPQVVSMAPEDTLRAGPGDYGGHQSYSIRGVWRNPPDSYPAAGPFVTLAIVCLEQDRMYLVDSWLYAPSRDKYEYMIQLEEILNSFRCTLGEPLQPGPPPDSLGGPPPEGAMEVPQGQIVVIPPPLEADVEPPPDTLGAPPDTLQAPDALPPPDAPDAPGA